MVDIFDSNNLCAKYIQPGRQLNKLLTVTGHSTMLDAMRHAVASWYAFLPAVEANGHWCAIAQYQSLSSTPNRSSPGTLRLSIYSQCYDPKSQVTVMIDGAPINQDSTPGDHAVTVSPCQFNVREAHVVKVLSRRLIRRHIAACREVSFLYARQMEIADGKDQLCPAASRTANAGP